MEWRVAEIGRASSAKVVRVFSSRRSESRSRSRFRQQRRACPPVLALVDADRDDGRRVEPARPTIRAMVRYAAREEMALRLPDVLFRRTGLGTIGHPGEDCLRECAAIMAAELGWDARRVEEEIAATRAGFPIPPAG